VALGAGLLGLGIAQLATAIGLRRGLRWSYAAAVIGGLFVAFTAGGSAVFMLAATAQQPQAAVVLVVGAVLVGLAAAVYGAAAVLTALGRRELEASAG
jgi:FtsH-binding integral membrane protein